MLKIEIFPYLLNFKEPGGTSRGVMYDRRVWFFKLYDKEQPEYYGAGECAPLPGLSCESSDDFPALFREMEEDVAPFIDDPMRLKEYPSVRFALEMALLDLRQGGRREWFPSPFTEGEDSVRINGLIWMGSVPEMLKRIEDKLRQGFRCLKMKIGAIDFEQEVRLIESLRSHFSASDLELRVDANGAFPYSQALERLDRLARFDLHSIEQPIRAGQWEEMADLCQRSAIPIALDEELIGINDAVGKRALLESIRPRYIILKPSLVGGFESSQEWLDRAEERGIQWWVTSALESNLGLNALAQWCYTLQNPLPQGLGTGQVFTNNLPSPLRLNGERLSMTPEPDLRTTLDFNK